MRDPNRPLFKVFLGVKLTETDALAVQRAARRRRQTISAFVRRAIADAMLKTGDGVTAKEVC